MKLVGVSGVAQLSVELFRNMFQEQKDSALEHYLLLQRCQLFGYFSDEEPTAGHSKLENLEEIRRHCLFLYCIREDCSFVGAFESASGQVNWQAEDTEEGHRKQLACPVCSLGTVKPFFWVKVNLKDHSTTRQPLTVIISSPTSHQLFGTDDDELLFGSPASTRLSSLVEEKMSIICSGPVGEEEVTSGPRYTVVLRPNRINKQRPGREGHPLSFAQGVLNQQLLGTENITVLNVVGISSSSATLSPSPST